MTLANKEVAFNSGKSIILILDKIGLNEFVSESGLITFGEAVSPFFDKMEYRLSPKKSVIFLLLEVT